MAKDQDLSKVITIVTDDKKGKVRIPEEVVSIIAGLAATEVSGIKAMAGNTTSELISKLGVKNLSKGVKASINGNNIAVDLSVIMDYGYNIMEVSRKVQDKVKAAIETMTGLEVTNVNIKIVDVDIEKEK